MSPLLTARPSVAVTLRLAGACAATALIAVLVALAGGGRPAARLALGRGDDRVRRQRRRDPGQLGGLPRRRAGDAGRRRRRGAIRDLAPGAGRGGRAGAFRRAAPALAAGVRRTVVAPRER